MATTEFAPYIVQTAFIINIGEASSKQSFKVSQGDILEFDGMSVEFNGIKGPAPTLRAALREGWILPAPKNSKGKVSRKDATNNGIFAQPTSKPGKTDTDPGMESFDLEKHAQKLPPVKQAVHSSTPEVSRTTREGKASVNTEAVHGGTTSQRGYAVEKEENRSVASVRASSGAPSPAKADLLSKKAAVEKQAVKPVRSTDDTEITPAMAKALSVFKEPARKRLSVVSGEESDSMQKPSKRATATKFESTLDGTSDAGVTDGEEGYTEVREKKSGTASVQSSDPGVQSGSPTRAKIKREEPQEVEAVYKGRRTTPAVTNISASQLESSTSTAEPKPMHREASLQRAGAPKVTINEEGQKTYPTRAIKDSASDGIISAKTAVGGNEPKDPTVQFGNSSRGETIESGGFIVGKKATITSMDHGIYDPDDSLGLGLNASAPKKSVAVIDPDAAEPEEEDYSRLNDVDATTEEDEAILAAALTPPPAPVLDDTEVPADFLDRLVVEGSSWESAKFYVKVKYISKCTNLSILALISGTKLQPSVRKVLEDRLALLTPSSKPQKPKPALAKKK